MSSDDNVIVFKKPENEDPEAIELTEEEIIDQEQMRIMKESMFPEEETAHTLYKDGAAQMILEFLAQDVNTWMSNNPGKVLVSWDYKDIFHRAYMKINELEESYLESQKPENEDTEENITKEEFIQTIREQIEEIKSKFAEREDTKPKEED